MITSCFSNTRKKTNAFDRSSTHGMRWITHGSEGTIGERVASMGTTFSQRSWRGGATDVLLRTPGQAVTSSGAGSGPGREQGPDELLRRHREGGSLPGDRIHHEHPAAVLPSFSFKSPVPRIRTALRHSETGLALRCSVVSSSPVGVGVSLLACVSFPNPSFVVQTGNSRAPCGILSVRSPDAEHRAVFIRPCDSCLGDDLRRRRGTALRQGRVLRCPWGRGHSGRPHLIHPQCARQCSMCPQRSRESETEWVGSTPGNRRCRSAGPRTHRW